jgi:hypothetical protein
MDRKPKQDWYWPLGSLGYQHEICDFFPEEAEMIGVITILWNRQELELRDLFIQLLEPREKAYAEAIWDRQSTHQNKRDLLALALEATTLTERQQGILKHLIKKTKTIADRRNELIHAEYVVHGRTDKLHAKVKTPRSSKPPKHQKVDAKDLQLFINELQTLVQMTEASRCELMSPKQRQVYDELIKQLDGLQA